MQVRILLQAFKSINLLSWRKGRRCGLKIRWFYTVWVQVPLGVLWICSSDEEYLTCKFGFVEFKHAFIDVSIRKSWVRVPPDPFFCIVFMWREDSLQNYLNKFDSCTMLSYILSLWQKNYEISRKQHKIEYLVDSRDAFCGADRLKNCMC